MLLEQWHANGSPTLSCWEGGFQPGRVLCRLLMLSTGLTCFLHPNLSLLDTLVLLHREVLLLRVVEPMGAVPFPTGIRCLARC